MLFQFPLWRDEISHRIEEPSELEGRAEPEELIAITKVDGGYS